MEGRETWPCARSPGSSPQIPEPSNAAGSGTGDPAGAPPWRERVGARYRLGVAFFGFFFLGGMADT